MKEAKIKALMIAPGEHPREVTLINELDALQKLPRIRLHDLRHTHATLLIQAGVSPKVVQERLGHSDVTVTLNTYTHVMPDMAQEAADKIDKLINF